MPETYKRNGLTVSIEQDMDPESPREWDNFGTMICSHSRYTLGDEQFNPDDFDGWDDLKKYLKKERNAEIILPLYLYDHSGITMYTTGDTRYRQHEAWDSGQVGFIYATKEKVDDEFDGDKEKAKQCLIGEVKTYDQYLTGEVYGFTIKDDHDNLVDSCYGFYSEQDAIDEANSVADHEEKPKKLEPVHYQAFRDLFKQLDINPYEFKQLSGDKVSGYFPNLSNRKSPINIPALATVLWGRKEEG
jgi:hypothetical protein